MIITPTEFARKCGISKQAIFKALDAGIIPFSSSGKKKLIDTDHPDIIAYAQSTSRQREDAKKNDAPERQIASKKQERKMSKQNNRSDIHDRKQQKLQNRSDIPANNGEETKYEIDFRTKKAKMREAELKADALEKKLLPTDFVQDHLFRYIEKLNSNIERTASVYVTDMGKQILSDGEVLPKHIEKFTGDCLALIDDTKKAIVKAIKKYEPKL